VTTLKLLVWLLRIAVFIGLFGLAIKNSGPMELAFLPRPGLDGTGFGGDPDRGLRRRQSHTRRGLTAATGRFPALSIDRGASD
jgi:hypothetical protein